MSRTIDSALLTALQQIAIEPFFALEFMLDDLDGTREYQSGYVADNAIRLWTGISDKTITTRGTANTFAGTGTLLTISGLEEVNDLSAKSVTVTLSGMPTDMISLALQEKYQRRRCSIYFGEQSQNAVVEVFSGKINTMRLVDEGETSQIEVTIESKLVELARASNYRYTDESHKARYPGDTFSAMSKTFRTCKFLGAARQIERVSPRGRASTFCLGIS